MTTNPLILLAALLLPDSCATQPVPVFVAGKEGYKSFRIPAIIRIPGKILLAFCEGRKAGSADFGDIDIVMKQSRDNGKTWSPLQVVADNGLLQAGNPAPVVDALDPDHPSGRIFLFYNTGNNHEGEVARGNGLRECFYITSADGGKNWSAPVNITRAVHRPRQLPYGFSDDWRTYANTPGHALQINAGAYKGRIYVAANHSAGDPRPAARHYAAHGYFSDDHGKTFSLGETISFPGSNEATAASLSGGRLLLNARNQGGDIRSRITAISKDGGTSWDTVYADRQLPDPVCQGSLLNMGTKKGKAILAFCNAADTLRRNHLTLRISFDEGRRWKINKLVDKDPVEGSQKDYTAYSDIVQLGKQKTGILYERDDYQQIVFVTVQW